MNIDNLAKAFREAVDRKAEEPKLIVPGFDIEIHDGQNGKLP